MNDSEYKIILKIISKNIGVSESKITKNSCANDFDKWDSIAHLKIMLELENKMKTKINTSQMAELNTVSKIINFIKK